VGFRARLSGDAQGWNRFLIVSLPLAAVLAAAPWLHFAPVKDEVVFLEASRYLGGQFPPTVDQLRSYSVMQTPLAFVAWGQLGRLTGDALFSGRLLNLVLALAIVGLVVFRSGRLSKWGLLCALGLSAYPYLFPLGVHLYTDIPATFLVLSAVCAHVRGRPRIAFVLFALAIATRQYMVAFPLAIAAWEWTRSGSRSWSRGTWAALGAATLLGWFAFFGGLAPKAGEERWMPLYPAPMVHAGSFFVDYGLYFLAGLGAYFVVPELLLFRDRSRWASVTAPKSAMLALSLLVLFALFPISFDPVHGGALVRAARLVLPSLQGDDSGLLLLCYALALLAVIRFVRQPDLGFWIVVTNFLLMTKTQIAWDKYDLAAITVLWFLKAEGVLEGQADNPSAHRSVRTNTQLQKITRENLA
jgi:hypothetical protein